MKRMFVAALAAAVVVPLAAQTAAPAVQTDPSKVVVASVNGETISQARLDEMWNRIGEKTRQQYLKNGGGKAGFLENYLRKRLIIQEAQQKGFDKRPDVQIDLDAARESALFDLYIRDVLASAVVSDADVQGFYQSNVEQFKRPARVHLRHILVKADTRTPAEARAILAKAMTDLFTYQRSVEGTTDGDQKFEAKFADVAAKISEDPSATSGGDLGWVTRESLDPKVADAAFSIKPGTMSGIIELTDGLHLILPQEREGASVEPFDSAKPSIREFLMARNAQKVIEIVNKKTTELRAQGKVAVYPENIH